ncbi:Undecaprenyl-phosphate mannosyltransferase [Rubripirellula tenax]|uniref:Undecaprenyl-phosphate mannosyltransferase n=1 Tax=Rubripirellula tenax TaxID=2528015 RepID=A0A5C6EET2_9BACT|nr:polyprenol monophosphomannose synthase [Rubripirellula tenax]TWU47338.1 Undecaprenyl-phosphate mannosyltransferase [Rubripirellula tenax]
MNQAAAPIETNVLPRVLVGVCTLNEVGNITAMIERLRLVLPEADVLIVDDNSSDGTSQAVTQWASQDKHVKLLTRYERGLGGAIRTAMQAAVDGKYDFFLNLDGDLSHSPDDLPRLLDRADQQPPVDVVVGSRYIDGGQIVGWPIHRKWMSRIVNRFATLCLRLPVKDCSGSMRCYRVSSLGSMDLASLRSNGYSVLEEVLVRLNRMDAAMAEVPITFTDRTKGESKLTIREAIRSTWQILNLAFRR